MWQRGVDIQTMRVTEKVKNIRVEYVLYQEDSPRKIVPGKGSGGRCIQLQYSDTLELQQYSGTTAILWNYSNYKCPVVKQRCGRPTRGTQWQITHFKHLRRNLFKHAL